MAPAAVPLARALCTELPPRGHFPFFTPLLARVVKGPAPAPHQFRPRMGTFTGRQQGGGANALGTVYKLTPGGTLTTLYSFTGGTDGSNPDAPLVQGTDGNLYGSTPFGGVSGGGAIYKISTGGKLKVLHTFTNTSDGGNPVAGLIQGTDGNFYGTNILGGANNNGVVFKITASGTFKVLHDFQAATDGAWSFTALVQATDGNFYGTCTYDGGIPGGDYGQGSIYKLTRAGAFSTVYLFDGTVGNNPIALVQNTDELLYGDTQLGPKGGFFGLVYSLNIGAKPLAKLALTSGKIGQVIGIFGQGFLIATGVTFGGVSTKFSTAGGNYLTATVPAGARTGSVVVKIPSGNLTSSLVFKVTPTLKTFSPSDGPVALLSSLLGPA